LPVSTMSQWWVKRSSNAVVILASDWCQGRCLGQVVHLLTSAVFGFYPRADAPHWVCLRL
jgi:hypothetical protein